MPKVRVPDWRGRDGKSGKRKVLFKLLKKSKLCITQGWGEPPGPSAQVDLNFHEGKPKGMEIQNCESPCFVVFLLIWNIDNR